MTKCTLKNSSLVVKKAKLSVIALIATFGITMGALALHDTRLIAENNRKHQELKATQSSTIVKITSDPEFQNYLNDKIAAANKAKEEGFLSEDEYEERVRALSADETIISSVDNMSFISEELRGEIKDINSQLEVNEQEIKDLGKQEVLHTIGCVLPLCGTMAYVMDKLDKRKQRDDKKEVNFEM